MTDKCDNCGKQVADNEEHSKDRVEIGDKHFIVHVSYPLLNVIPDAAQAPEQWWIDSKRRNAWLCNDCYHLILAGVQ